MDEKKLTYQQWIDSFPENFPYYNPATTNPNNPLFPIVASGIKYNNGTKEIPFEELVSAKNCGFTVGMQASVSNGNEGITKSLENARSANIRVMFSNNAFKEYGIEGMLPKDEDLKEWFGGIRWSDEPSIDEVKTSDSPEGTNLQKGYRALQEQNTPYIIYINLKGEIDPIDIKAEENVKYTYEDYVKDFQKNFKPALFSYDSYPIYEKISLLYEGFSFYTPVAQEGKVVFTSDSTNQFYENLDLFSEKSKENNRPFWAYCQSLSYMSLDLQWFRPIALEQYLRFEAFLALAYGAQGLVYWGFAMRPNEPAEAYFSALLNRRNEPTASWYFAKKVNDEIKKYSYIFLNNRPQETEKSKVYNYPLSNDLFSIKITSLSGQEIVVARFISSLSTYLVIVSTDALNYIDIDINLNVRSVSLNPVNELTPITSQGKEGTQLLNGSNLRILPPGGFRILSFRTRQIIPLKSS